MFVDAVGWCDGALFYPVTMMWVKHVTDLVWQCWLLSKV